MASFLDLNQDAETPKDWRELHYECQVTHDNFVESPEIILSAGEYREDGIPKPIHFMTAGEFSVITGVSKSKKSFLKSGLAAKYIGYIGDPNSLYCKDFFPNIDSWRKQDFAVVDIDTEQGVYFASKSFQRVDKMTGGRYKHYYTYTTRKKSESERIRLLDSILENQIELYGVAVKLVFIDGVADLCENTNDLVLSKELSDKLLFWTENYNIHICTIIHKSAATGKPLGHLGTYVMKKAETILDLTLVEENDTVLVHQSQTRGFRIQDFSFHINESGLPQQTDNGFL